jgi:hypothetical protein
VSHESFRVNDTIFINSQDQVNNGNQEDGDASKTIEDMDETLWVASIVDIRAHDSSNVWVKVKWFYRPNELPHGREPYHGSKEVIKSSVVDFVSAYTVAGHAQVSHWVESDDEQDANGIDGLVWRQTLHPRTGKLSVRYLTVLQANSQSALDFIVSAGRNITQTPSCTGAIIAKSGNMNHVSFRGSERSMCR